MKQFIVTEMSVPAYLAQYIENGTTDHLTPEEIEFAKNRIKELTEQGIEFSSMKDDEPYFCKQTDFGNDQSCEAIDFYVHESDEDSQERQHLFNRLKNRNVILYKDLLKYAQSLEILFRHEIGDSFTEMVWAAADSYGYSFVPIFLEDLEEQCEEWELDPEIYNWQTSKQLAERYKEVKDQI